jgi:hypothetical protein
MHLELICIVKIKSQKNGASASRVCDAGRPINKECTYYWRTAFSLYLSLSLRAAGAIKPVYFIIYVGRADSALAAVEKPQQKTRRGIKFQMHPSSLYFIVTCDKRIVHFSLNKNKHPFRKTPKKYMPT